MRHVWCAAAGVVLAVLIGCSGQSAEELFDTAQFEERQNNVAHAKQLYEEIVKKYPDSDLAMKAQERIAKLATSR